MHKSILLLFLLASSATAQAWQCRNDFEARCVDGKCKTEKQGSFTPMSVSFNDLGKMSVCAYSGCWEGTGKVVNQRNFLVLTGYDLKFSTALNSDSMGKNISITLDRNDNVAILKAGEFAFPLACTSKEPTFADYKTRVSKARPKPIRFRGNRNARMFRTRLRAAHKGGVNFAGHYIYTTWGCGTSCVQGAIIDTKTGIVYFPDELAGVSFGMIMQLDLPEEPWDFQKDSRLFILNGHAANAKNAGTTYLAWQGTKFKLIKFVKAKKRK